MRQSLTRADEPHLLIRSLAVDYSAGGREDVHSHPWPQFLYAQAGAIRAEIGRSIWTLPTRRGLWIPAHTPHRLSMSSRLQLRTLYIRPDLAIAERPTGVVQVSGLLHEAILRVCERGALDARDDAARSLATIIMAEIAVAERGPITLLWPDDRRAARLADLLLRADCAGVSLNTLCARAGLSRRTAERVFHDECGISPARWRRYAALSEGLVSIAGGGTIDDAASVAGYQSRSAFSEAFSAAFGFSPSGARLG